MNIIWCLAYSFNGSSMSTCLLENTRIVFNSKQANSFVYIQCFIYLSMTSEDLSWFHSWLLWTVLQGKCGHRQTDFITFRYTYRKIHGSYGHFIAKFWRKFHSNSANLHVWKLSSKSTLHLSNDITNKIAKGNVVLFVNVYSTALTIELFLLCLEC